MIDAHLILTAGDKAAGFTPKEREQALAIAFVALRAHGFVVCGWFGADQTRITRGHARGNLFYLCEGTPTGKEDPRCMLRIEQGTLTLRFTLLESVDALGSV